MTKEESAAVSRLVSAASVARFALDEINDAHPSLETDAKIIDLCLAIDQVTPLLAAPTVAENATNGGECRNELANTGRAYPRTCRTCGLNKCAKGVEFNPPGYAAKRAPAAADDATSMIEEPLCYICGYEAGCHRMGQQEHQFIPGDENGPFIADDSKELLDWLESYLSDPYKNLGGPSPGSPGWCLGYNGGAAYIIDGAGDSLREALRNARDAK